jgi:hypothetical protein
MYNKKNIMKNFTKQLVALFIGLLLTILGFGQTPTDGDYRSAATGDWDALATWQTRISGNWVPATALPTSTNNVYIQTGHTVTVNIATASVNDLHVNTTGVTAIGTNTLTVSGKMRAYTGAAVTATGADGTFYSGQTNSVNPGSNSITSTGAGKLSVIGNSRTLFNTGEWGAFTTGFAMEINITSGQIASCQTSSKAASWNVVSGTLDAASTTISADNGTTGGNITIAAGATISSNRTGAQAVFQRTGTTLGGTLLVNGTLRLTGTNPAIAMTTINLSNTSTVEFANTGAQNLNTIPSGTNQGGAQLMTTFNNLTLSGSGSKTLLNTAITVNGTMTLQNTATFSVSTFSIIYGSSSTLQYSGSVVQTANQNEWPSTSGPTNVIVNNPLGLRMNLNRTLTGNFTVLAGNIQNTATGGLRTLTMAGASSVISVATGASISGTTSMELGLAVSSGTTIIDGGSGALGPIFFSNTNVSAGATLVLSRDIQASSLVTPSDINGTLQIENGQTLSMGCTMNIAGGSIVTGAGSILYASSGKLVYTNGTAAQITTDKEWPTAMTTPVTINNVNGVTLNSSKTQNASLTLTSGNLSLGANNLTIGTTGSIIGGSLSSYIVTNATGALRIPNVGTTPVLFPVGPSSTAYHPATITNTGTADNFSVNVDGSASPSCVASSYSLPVTWNISEAIPGGSNCTLNLDYTGATTFGSSYDSTTAKIVHCSGGTPDYSNGSVVDSIATGTGFITFSPFGISSDPVILPISLISFSGKHNNGVTQLKWVTANEQNNKGFEIQRSVDGVNFITIDFVKSLANNGNSSSNITYSYTDAKAQSGKAYYRLKQIDNNQNSKYSQTIALTVEPINKLDFGRVFINEGKAVVNINSPINQRVDVAVFDANGKRIMFSNKQLNVGNNLFEVDMQNYSSGIYLITMMNNAKRITTKVVK